MPMSDFLQLVFRVFFSALGPALLCMILGTFAVVKIHDKRNPGNPLPVKKVIVTVLLLGYLC